MARVPQAGVRRHGSVTLDRARSTRKKKPYKLLYEMVTQEKKKLRSTMAYSKHAPRGYTFVPLGNRDLTEECKEQCRKKDLVAHIVSARSKADAPRDSGREEGNRIDTQRVGHHFPDAVVEEACKKLHYHRTRKGFSKYRPAGALFGGLQQLGNNMFHDGRQRTETETKEQIRSSMLEVFPKIPQTDLEAIVGHAFEEGTKKVGNAKDIPLARRVQLAVGAYIRHQYTDYDAILKRVPWKEARSLVEPVSYAKLLEWRDEANNPELEEIFREVIVIDDEEEDDENDDLDESDSLDSMSGDNSREPSFEIISSQATGRELQPDLAAGSRSHTSSYHPRVPAASGPRPPYSIVPSTQSSSSAAVAQPRLTRRPSPYSTAPVRVTKQAPKLHMIDGKWCELQPIEEPELQWRPRGVVHPPRRTVHREGEGGYVHAPPVSRALDNIQAHRSAPVPTSSYLPEDIPLPSVEREPEPPQLLSHIEEVRKTSGHDTRLNPIDYRGLEQAHPRSPRTTFRASSRDRRAGVPGSAYSYSRPVVYVDLDPSPSSQVSMPYQLQNREPVRAHDRSRRQNEQDYIDLTTSPLRRSDQERERRSGQERVYYLRTSAPSFASVSSSVSNVFEPHRGIPLYAPEHRGLEVYTPPEDEAHLRGIRSRYVEPDIRRTSRSVLPDYGRGPR